MCIRDSHQFYERRERARALTRLNLGDAPDVDFVPEGQVKKTLMPKRQLLLQAIERDPSIAKRVNVDLPRICLLYTSVQYDRCESHDAAVYRFPARATPNSARMSPRSFEPLSP